MRRLSAGGSSALRGTPEAPHRSHTLTGTNLRRANISAFILLFATMGLISGCGNIMVTDRTPPTAAYPQAQRAAISDVPNTREMHDLAVAAVDFDPALDMQQVLAGKPYTLLVAVENRGNRREGPFTVSAQLLSQDQRQVFVSAQRVVSMLSPGDITVVKFPNDTTPPLRRAYILKAQVQTVPREANSTNNERLLQIDVNTGN